MDHALVEQHDVFISHAGEDKDSTARPLAKGLRELGYRVWFDEFELRMGMSLRRSIDKGLAGSRFGVVILSPVFFGKEWPERELDGLAARETADGTHLILPIWHEVDRQIVTTYSPTLADRVAAKTADGLDVVIAKVVAAIGPVGTAASTDKPIVTPDVRLTPVPKAVDMSPVLLGTQLVRLIEAGFEIVLDLDSLPPGPGRRRTAKLFDELRDWGDAISEAGYAQRDELADQFSDQLRMLLDAGVVLLGGTYKRTLQSPQGDEPWPGAVIRAVPLDQVRRSAKPAPGTMSSEDATLLALAQVQLDRGNDEGAEQQLRPLAERGNSHAMLLLGMVLRDRGGLDEAAEMLTRAADAGRSEARTQFGDADDPALRAPVANALLNKGVQLGQLGRGEEELAVYDQLLAWFGDADDPALRAPVAQALLNKGVKLGRSAEALAVYGQLLARFGDADEPALRVRVANALVHKGATLGQLGRVTEALAVSEDVLARFGDADEPALRVAVAQALLNKGVTLGQLGRSVEALAVSEDVLARFGDADELALRERVANALVNKGMTLGQLGRAEEELAVYDQLLARFGDADEPALREVLLRVSKAREGQDDK